MKMLVELQALDREIFEKRTILDEGPRKLKELAERLEKKSMILKSKEEDLKKFQLQRKEKEGQLQAKEQAIKKHQAQLFQVKTNQEYTSLEKETASIKADSSILEDEIISLLDQAEEAQKVVSRDRALLEEEKNKAGREKAEIESEGKAAEVEYNDFKGRRETFAKKLDSLILSKYERVLAKRSDSAVVPIVGDVCGGCNMNLPPQVINEVKLQKDLRFCENCARILYTKE